MKTPSDTPSIRYKQQQIMAALLAGEELTQLDSWDRWRASRLASTVHLFKSRGIEIESRWHKTPTSRWKSYRIAPYALRGTRQIWGNY